MHFISIAAILFASNLAAVADEPGIPVTDPLVLAKCAPCHLRDGHGRLERISWSRATPEGWQSVLKRMILDHGVSVDQRWKVQNPKTGENVEVFFNVVFFNIDAFSDAKSYPRKQ